MSVNRRRKKKIKRISFDKRIIRRNFIVLLALALVVFGVRFVIKYRAEKEAAKLYITTAFTGEALPEAEKALITDYFTRFNSSLAKLEKQNIRELFMLSDPASYENAAINDLALETLLGIRSYAAYDLKFKYMDLTLNVISASEVQNTTEIVLTEAHAVRFPCLKGETSYTCGIKHSFVIDKAANKIISHTDESSYLSAYEAFSGEKSDKTSLNETECDVVASTALELINKEISAFSGIFNTKRRNYIANPENFIYTKEVSLAYNRAQSVNYALLWCGEDEVKRNPDFSIYDDIGGNCNNFISQCIYAGGVPFDDTGDDQWKHYSDELNESNTKSGRTASWTSVSDFYEYCDDNTSGGIAAETGANFYAGEPGDIIQIGANGSWNHSVIINALIMDENGNILDYAVCSNTTDRKNYPLSAFGVMYSMRLIKIFGSY